MGMVSTTVVPWEWERACEWLGGNGIFPFTTQSK